MVPTQQGNLLVDEMVQLSFLLTRCNAEHFSFPDRLMVPLVVEGLIMFKLSIIPLKIKNVSR